MAERDSTNPTNNSDEIDLGQLFQMIGRGFNRLFRAFLRLFLYLKKNVLILLGLAILGGAIGYTLNQIVTKKLKTEVIVKPQMESKNYLYDVVNEVQANIKSKDTTFFKRLGINIEMLDGLEVSIAPVDDGKVSSESEMKFLELLQSFESTDAISDIVRAELQNKSSFNHRITFSYKDAEKGQEFVEKVMDYINSNSYFDELIEVYQSNAKKRIEENEILLKQADDIIINYSNKIARGNQNQGSDRIVLESEESVDITGLFEYKNSLIRDIEARKLELIERTDPIKIINFGQPQQIQKAFFGKNIVLIPLILIGLFFLGSFLIYLNKKAEEL
ncbi:hypothetical protein [Maribacter sp. 2304DJ31-5]|uniref:hypothetical protein n=1 Tax=Maribacter sp. 2304DJ31-5 TaxID=3386273 RepID=UPI0039BD3C11